MYLDLQKDLLKIFAVKYSWFGSSGFQNVVLWSEVISHFDYSSVRYFQSEFRNCLRLFQMTDNFIILKFTILCLMRELNPNVKKRFRVNTYSRRFTQHEMHEMTATAWRVYGSPTPYLLWAVVANKFDWWKFFFSFSRVSHASKMKIDFRIILPSSACISFVFRSELWMLMNMMNIALFVCLYEWSGVYSLSYFEFELGISLISRGRFPLLLVPQAAFSIAMADSMVRLASASVPISGFTSTISIPVKRPVSNIVSTAPIPSRSVKPPGTEEWSREGRFSFLPKAKRN